MNAMTTCSLLLYFSLAPASMLRRLMDGFALGRQAEDDNARCSSDTTEIESLEPAMAMDHSFGDSEVQRNRVGGVSPVAALKRCTSSR